MEKYLVCNINPFLYMQTFYRWDGINPFNTKNQDSYMGQAVLDRVPATLIEIAKNWGFNTVIINGEKTYIEPIVEELKNNEINVIIGEQRNDELFN